jgi:hypothetical protein
VEASAAMKVGSIVGSSDESNKDSIGGNQPLDAILGSTVGSLDGAILGVLEMGGDSKPLTVNIKLEKMINMSKSDLSF